MSYTIVSTRISHEARKDSIDQYDDSRKVKQMNYNEYLWCQVSHERDADY